MSDGTETGLASTAVWTDELCRLEDFSKRHALPAFALIQKGTYRGIGQGQSQGQQVIYVHEVKTGEKVLAEGVKQKTLGDAIKQNGRGMKYSFPVTYGGWFEVLSEDGKPIQPINGVEELARAAPQQCLVREAFRAPVSGPSSPEDLSTDRLRQLKVGDRLTLRGEVEVAFQGSRGGVAKKRYLRCSDDQGEHVYLPLDLRTQFSPIAGPTNIAGVHSIRGLLEKFRLPIVVRLVHGVIPARVQRNFTPVFRLVGAYKDETAFLLPLPLKENKMVTVSTREPLVLSPARNCEALRKTSEFELCRERCETSVQSYLGSVHILVDQPDPAAISRGKVWQRSEAGYPDSRRNDGTTDDEIDDIYRYVREGGDPPAPRSGPTSASRPSKMVHSNGVRRNRSDGKMETQEATMTISETVSGKDQGLLVVQGHGEAPDDDGYWEEPIYEDIEKIRERKMAERTSVVIGNENEPASLLPVTNKSTGQRLGPELKTEAKSGTKFAELGAEVDPVRNGLEGESRPTGMVHNLRQIFLPSATARPASMKRKATGETTVETQEPIVTQSPLIPPKCFDEPTALERPPALSKSKVNASAQGHSGDVPKPARTLSLNAPVSDCTPAIGPKSPPPKVLPKKKTHANSRGPPEISSNPPSRNSLLKNEPVLLVSAAQSNARNSPSPRIDCDSPRPSLPNPISTPDITKLQPVSVLNTSQEPVSAANGASTELRGNPVSSNYLSEKRVSTPEPPKPEGASLQDKPNQLVSAVQKLTNKLPETVALTPKIQKSETVSFAPSVSKTENLVSAKDTFPSNPVSTNSFSQIQAVPQNPVLQIPVPQNVLQQNPVPQHPGPSNPIPMNHVPPTFLATNPTFMHSISTNPVSMNPVSMNPVSMNPVSLSPVSMSVTTPTVEDPLRSATPDPLSFRRSESPPRPITINTTSSRINWTSGSGSTIQVGNYNANTGFTATDINGVTTIKVNGSRLDPKTSSQGQYPAPGNTMVHVRLPNSSIGNAVYRPQGATTGLRIQSGTVYLTNSKVVENDHWA